MDPVITAQNVSKKYQINHYRGSYVALRDRLQQLLTHPIATLREARQANEEFWALKDISFTINRGDVVGIIGANGAGKSTLLKILSRITPPTEGSITINGRISSLLEVGTGFHPELTGRENIFLNGAVLGMKKAEIIQRFDEIVEFSEIAKFIDTPVKFYSSGMYMRLAFAVAAHLEPDILIVDEVLAVGDAEFQKKCLGKMKDVSSQGRTVLFVSHNMEAVQKLCTTGILLDRGEIVKSGDIKQIIELYLSAGNLGATATTFEISKEIILGQPLHLQVKDESDKEVRSIPVGRVFSVKVRFKINEKIEHFIIALGLQNISAVAIRTSYSKPCIIDAGEYEAIFKYDDIILASGTYSFTLGLSTYERSFFFKEGVASLHISEVSDVAGDERILRNSGVGIILNPIDVIIRKL